MRREPTEAEEALWRLLRCKRLAGSKFKRQQRFEEKYVVDVVCFGRRVIVEADGSQHAESDYDAQRDAWLHEQGYMVLRFWNNDVLARPESVLTAILSALESGNVGIEPALPLTPLPGPPPQGGREKKDDMHG